MNIADKILEIVKEDFKVSTNQEYHIVDLSYSILKSSDPSLSKDRYNKILLAFSQELTNTVSLLDTIQMVQKKSGNYLVNDPTHGTYVVGKTYNSLKRVIGKILQQVDIDSGLSGTEDDNTLDNQLVPVGTKKPLLSNKLNSMLVRLPLQTAKPILRELKELQNNYSTKVDYSFISSNTSGTLGTATVVLTLTTAVAKKEFAALEKKTLKNITKYLNSEEFADSILASKTGKKGSVISNIEEEIASAVTNRVPKIKAFKESSTSVQRTGSRTVSSNNTIKLRNKNTGQFYSLASLQRLLSLTIGMQIAKNMGNGYRRDILNFRTGRFARSVSIERLTQSRQGQITAFYSYMKYPYQTFEPGYAQGNIGTRNPRLLISKSIREIAATAVANRLRAVLV